MFSKIKDFLFGSAPVQSPVAAPYKVETTPVEAASAPAVEAVIVVPEAVVPAGLVDQAPAPVATKKPRAPAKPKAVKPAVVKAPAAPKKPRAPKAK